MLSTYLPAVQAAHEGEGPAGCTVQLHMVSPQDEVTQLHAVQRLGLGHVQATHEAASADVEAAESYPEDLAKIISDYREQQAFKCRQNSLLLEDAI